MVSVAIAPSTTKAPNPLLESSIGSVPKGMDWVSLQQMKAALTAEQNQILQRQAIRDAQGLFTPPESKPTPSYQKFPADADIKCYMAFLAPPPTVKKINLIASGGISSLEDVVKLKNLESEERKKLWGAITGKAIYEDKLDFKEALEKLK